MKRIDKARRWVPSLYFAEGLPNVLVTGLAPVMYMQMGLSDAELALYTGWLALPWVIKPLWSPFIDLLKTKRWWVLSMQLLIGAALAGIAFTIPTAFWFQGTMFFLFVMAFASATHDISADGFYMIELFAFIFHKYIINHLHLIGIYITCHHQIFLGKSCLRYITTAIFSTSK